jgi:gliding motility-associated-like protein
MEEKDFIKDLFQEKLSNFDTPVRPEIWSAISSSIGATSATTGLSLITKLIIGSSLTAAVSTGIWFAISNSEKESSLEKEPAKIEKPSVVETNEDALNKETSKPKFSDIEIKTSVDELILLPPESEMITQEDAVQLNQNPNNSTSELKGQITLEKQELKPAIAPKIESKSLHSVEHNSMNKTSDSRQVPTQSEVKINLPNVFTPNGDGNNDYLTIPKVELTDFSMVVLDDKGKTIFTSTDLEFNWDGTMMNGEKAPSGNYVYFITAKDLNGKTFTKYSNLSIRY